MDSLPITAEGTGQASVTRGLESQMEPVCPALIRFVLALQPNDVTGCVTVLSGAQNRLDEMAAARKFRRSADSWRQRAAHTGRIR
ncbi:hypothetical protein MTO96_049418 [Rhipicephalus appendiculatus]